MRGEAELLRRQLLGTRSGSCAWKAAVREYPAMERPSYGDLLKWLASEVPDLAPIYEQSVRDGNADLPYVVFESYYMRWFKGRAGQDPGDPAVAKFLACVEACLSGQHDEVANLLDIGFSENLGWGGDEETRVLVNVRDLLGPTTRANVAKYRPTIGPTT